MTVSKIFDHIGFPWEDLHRRSAVQTAKIETVFHRPSHHGDILHFNLGLLAIGSTSVTAKVEATSHDDPRLSHTATLVHIDASGKAHRWPDAIRTAMTPYLEILQA